MTTIKSYTDISQSRKLAEFLPLESADMFYNGVQDLDKKMVFNIPIDGRTITVRTGHIITEKGIKANLLLPCWSLASLLMILSFPNLFENDGWNLYTTIDEKLFSINNADNPVNACVEMVLKLHKQKLI